jgi:uncharacterized protein
MLRLISILSLAILAYMVLRTVISVIQIFRKGKRAERRLKERQGGEMAEDPVCHTYIPKSSAIQKNVSGKTFYFCGTECAEAFSRK